MLARLHLGTLATKHSRKALKLALQSLPIEFNRTYEDALRRINDQNKDDALLAEKVLLWVTYASNPLTLIELQHAIAAMDLAIEETEFDDEDLPDGDILISVCAGYVFNHFLSCENHVHLRHHNSKCRRHDRRLIS